MEQYLYELLYETEIPDRINIIKKCTDSKLLHMVIANYNWDDGTELPKTIVNNQYCDIGTALLVFELYEGYSYLLNKCDFSENDRSFLLYLKDRIEHKDFVYQSIQYIPELTRTQKYIIKKACPDISDTFIEGTDGEPIEIIVV